jgi:hypothetical protein
MARSENALLFITFFQRMESMVKPTQNTGKVIPFVTGQPSPEGQLEKWFRGIVQSNNDLISALEQLRDSYKNLFAGKLLGEADQAVLLAVEITLTNARNARVL